MSAMGQKRTWPHICTPLIAPNQRGRPQNGLFTGGSGIIRMTDDWKKTVHRNKLLGMWAAEKLGITGQDAEDYSDALAVGALDPERSDVLSKIRKDFHAAGVVQSDEQILRVMNELMLQAGSLMPGTRGDALDALTVLLARKLADMSRHSANIKSLHRRRPHEERDSKDRVDE
jgi:hypothetical protein